jgi:hypothetical protein
MAKSQAQKDAKVKTCFWGCGGEVKREFLPGHDPKHKSALIARIVGGDSRSADVKAATSELELRGWRKFLDRKLQIIEKAAANEEATKIAKS